MAINGPGMQVLAGTNSYSGGTILQAGTLNYATVAALGQRHGDLYRKRDAPSGRVRNARQCLDDQFGATGTLDTQANALTLGGVISGPGGWRARQRHTDPDRLEHLYRHDKINGGTLSLANAAALGSGNITFGGGTLQFSASNANDYSAKIVSSNAAILLDTNRAKA